MMGVYLYCVKGKSDSKFSTEGIGGGKIFAIPYQDLEAVVSEVSLEEFDSKEIQRKAQEDLGWIKNKAQIHEKVIEEAMRPNSHAVYSGGRFRVAGMRGAKATSVEARYSGAVIPMRFGTIFKTKENLEETLKKHCDRFRKVLERLKGKQEWSVKVYLNRKTFGEEIKKVSPVVQEKENEIAQLPEGMAYFMQKQIDEAVSKEADKALENYTESFFEDFKKYVEAGTKGKILEKELTGRFLPMVLNAIFLVSEEKLEDFIKEIDKLNQEYKQKGFSFEYSGPWPPYNFI